MYSCSARGGVLLIYVYMYGSVCLDLRLSKNPGLIIGEKQFDPRTLNFRLPTLNCESYRCRWIISYLSFLMFSSPVFAAPGWYEHFLFPHWLWMLYHHSPTLLDYHVNYSTKIQYFHRLHCSFLVLFFTGRIKEQSDTLRNIAAS